MTRVHARRRLVAAADALGRPLCMPIRAVARLIVNGQLLAAEDKSFYEHGGLDFQGITRAGLLYVQNIGTNRRPQGASTITQQVAKKLLLHQRGLVRSQAQGGAARAQDRAHLFEG